MLGGAEAVAKAADSLRDGFVGLDCVGLDGLFVDLKNEILPAFANLGETPEVGGLEDLEADFKVRVGGCVFVKELVESC